METIHTALLRECSASHSVSRDGDRFVKLTPPHLKKHGAV
jgi:hypothetical protein